MSISIVQSEAVNCLLIKMDSLLRMEILGNYIYLKKKVMQYGLLIPNIIAMRIITILKIRRII